MHLYFLESTKQFNLYIEIFSLLVGSPLENTVDTSNNQLSSKDGENKTLGSIRDENMAQNSAQRNGAPSISTISLHENSILRPASLMMYPTCQGNICKNYAKCSIENSIVKCHCPLGFIGKSCDKGKTCFFNIKIFLCC